SPIVSPIDYRQSNYKVNDFKRQPLMVNPISFQGPSVKKVDIDQDGLEDVFVGGGPGQPAQLFLQTKDGSFVLIDQPAFNADKNRIDADVSFFDANGDGKTDIFIASGGYHRYLPKDPLLQDRLYLNDGKGTFIRSSTDALPQSFISSMCVKVDDINGDGFPDLFVGGRVIPGRYPEIPESSILINDGQGNFMDQTNHVAPEIKQLGMITDAIWIDLNSDQKNDLVVVGEWMPITVFINENGRLANKTSDYFDKEYAGWWNTINTGDYNGDGIIDIVVGNMGLNTQCKVSFDQPAELFYKDFDDNGSIDPIFCFYNQNVSYPYMSRDELLYQLPMMRTRFPDYKSYADAGLNQLFTDSERSGMKSLRANCLETILFVGNEHNQF